MHDLTGFQKHVIVYLIYQASESVLRSLRQAEPYTPTTNGAVYNPNLSNAPAAPTPTNAYSSSQSIARALAAKYTFIGGSTTIQ